jgi:hypothetical protein
MVTSSVKISARIRSQLSTATLFVYWKHPKKVHFSPAGSEEFLA